MGLAQVSLQCQTPRTLHINKTPNNNKILNHTEIKHGKTLHKIHMKMRPQHYISRIIHQQVQTSVVESCSIQYTLHHMP